MGDIARLRLVEDAHSHGMAKDAGGHLLRHGRFLRNLAESGPTVWRDHICDIELGDSL